VGTQISNRTWKGQNFGKKEDVFTRAGGFELKKTPDNNPKKTQGKAGTAMEKGGR